MPALSSAQSHGPMAQLTPCAGPLATPAAMAPLHRSNTDGPRKAALPPKPSIKSHGSILSHVTSGTWEEDADIENPQDAEHARASKKVRAALRTQLQSHT